MNIYEEVKIILEERGYIIRLSQALEEEEDWFYEVVDATIEAMRTPVLMDKQTMGHDGC